MNILGPISSDPRMVQNQLSQEQADDESVPKLVLFYSSVSGNPNAGSARQHARNIMQVILAC